MNNKISPFKLSSPTREYIWGGTKLAELWNKVSGTQKIAESWELSLYPKMESIVANGKFKGTTLASLLEEYPELGGQNLEKFPTFPILIKLIDAMDNLSIQVHPEDEYALTNEMQLGKTEMWYIADAEEGAGIYLGLKQDIIKSQLEESIKNNSICDLLNFVEVKTGDAFMIEAGTIHAILKGITVIEVQENSNVTYRVYDYDRKDASGRGRELHIVKALDVIKLKKTSLENTINEVQKFETYQTRALAKCQYFDVKECIVASEMPLFCAESFIAITVVEGKGKIEEMDIKKGDTVFVPSNFDTKLLGEIKVIHTTI